MSFSFSRRVETTRALPSFSSVRALTVGLGVLLVSGSAAAQTPVFVSTTNNTTVGTATFDDGAVLFADGASSPVAFFRQEHWLGTSGIVPSDIDAFARVPGAPAGSARSFAFSLLSNEGGFLDGDVLSFAPGGGFEAIVTEAEITAALGVPLANIDLDALDFDLVGCLFFSLQSDLGGTGLGDLLDGDVICYEQSTNKVWIDRTEADIQAAFTLATGLAAAIGDVQGLDVVNGDLWVVTQAPSSHDGAILALGATPVIVLEESVLGLGGAEVDALSLAEAGDRIATITVEPSEAMPGDLLNVTLRGEPNTVYVALMSGSTGWIDFGARGGFGAWYLDATDPWLGTILGMPSPPYGLTDSFGVYTVAWNLPLGAVHGLGFGGEEGWTFQVLELPSFRTSSPCRVLKL